MKKSGSGLSKIPASVYIITCDSERTIRRTLESVKDFAEIIIVDSGSKDNTLEIAESYGCRIYHRDWQGYARQKQYALSLCSNDWVLNVDSDEAITDTLRQEICEAISKNNIDGLSIPIRDVFMGKLNHPWIRLNRQVRFFRKHKGKYSEVDVHESISIDGIVTTSKGCLIHDGVPSIHVMVDKNNRYSTLKAKEKYAKNRRSSYLKLLFIFPVMFIKTYLFKRHFLNGRRGLILSVNSAFYAFLKEAKLYECEINREKH